MIDLNTNEMMGSDLFFFYSLILFLSVSLSHNKMIIVMYARTWYDSYGSDKEKSRLIEFLNLDFFFFFKDMN